MSVMPDDKRLGVLALAQSGAFAIVLILGAFSSPGHPAAPHHTLPASAKQTRSVLPSQTATPGVTLTITASPAQGTPVPTVTGGASVPGAPSGPFQGSPVKVIALDVGQPTRDAPALDSADVTRETVPGDHSYLICLLPPQAQGWGPGRGGAIRFPPGGTGTATWICVSQYVGATPAQVNIPLKRGAHLP
jgi:hypothetical protein